MQALYLLALDPCAETTADRSSYGFRVGRSCADALNKCYILLGKSTSANWILEGDIRACFDRISHEWLMQKVPLEKRILQKWLKAGYLEKEFFHHTEEGTPQGGIISPVLSNLVLDGLEDRLREVFPKPKTKSQPNRVYLVRYADDFIITGDSQELLRDQVKPLVEKFLKERGLELSREKTKITSIQQGFDFLGQTIRKYHGKFLTRPSKESVKRLLTKVRGMTRKYCSATPGHLIVLLNPIIRGWANYHRWAASKETFVSIDHMIFCALWRWARRRHSNKSGRWVMEKYFHHSGNRHWVFVGEVETTGESMKEVRLFRASDKVVARYIHIKEEANPYEPKWYSYFESR